MFTLKIENKKQMYVFFKSMNKSRHCVTNSFSLMKDAFFCQSHIFWWTHVHTSQLKCVLWPEINYQLTCDSHFLGITVNIHDFVRPFLFPCCCVLSVQMMGAWISTLSCGHVTCIYYNINTFHLHYFILTSERL